MIVNAIPYLSFAWYSVLSLIFFCLLQKITKIIENMTFSLIFVLPKIWYFRQLPKKKKIRYLLWAYLRKCCFSWCVWKYQKSWCSLAGICFLFIPNKAGLFEGSFSRGERGVNLIPPPLPSYFKKNLSNFNITLCNC